MNSLEHYDLWPDFGLREAAYLAAGIDPAAIAHHSKANSILARMNRAVGEMFDVVSKRGRSIEFGNFPTECLVPVVFDVSEPLAVQSVERRVRDLANAYQQFCDGSDKLRFSRPELARWFEVVGGSFRPAYQFVAAPIGPAAPVAMLNPNPSKDLSRPLAERERLALLRVIGAMVELAIAPGQRWPSQTALIQELCDNYGDKDGISRSGLEGKFAEAKRTLQD